jgi:hypothetical protein
MRNLQIKLNPEGKTAKGLRDWEIQNTDITILQNKPDNQKLVYEFEKCSNAEPFDGDIINRLFDSRSPDVAFAILVESIDFLIDGKPLPANLAHILAEALKRVLENKERTEFFVYGARDKAGRPPTDQFRNLQIFLTIEEQYAKKGRYASGRKGQGAYEATKKLLQDDGIFLEVEALKRIRDQVIGKASDDPEYFGMLVQFIGSFGYKARGM